jgi:hypothetical protein
MHLIDMVNDLLACSLLDLNEKGSACMMVNYIGGSSSIAPNAIRCAVVLSNLI